MHVFEMVHLLKLCGFTVEGVFGDFYGNALSDEADTVIWVAQAWGDNNNCVFRGPRSHSEHWERGRNGLSILLISIDCWIDSWEPVAPVFVYTMCAVPDSMPWFYFS